MSVLNYNMCNGFVVPSSVSVLLRAYRQPWANTPASGPTTVPACWPSDRPSFCSSFSPHWVLGNCVLTVWPAK